MRRTTPALSIKASVDSYHQSVSPAVSSVPSGRMTFSGSRVSNLMAVAFTVLVCVLIATGFVLKKRDLFVPGEGLGYVLGIAGGSSMLLLLLYPVVKRTSLFKDGSKSGFWFRWHMILGILGPLLILYHANFSTGATNSNVALAAMLIVAASGVMGRYIYSMIHQGLYGAKTDLGGLLARATKLVSEVERDVGGANGVVAKALSDFGEAVLPGKRASSSIGISAVLAMPFRVKFARSRIMREVRASIKANAQVQQWSRAEKRAHFLMAQRDVNEFLGAVSRAAHMSFWERIFSLWHVLHVPLFFLLLVSGVVHVIAVHLY